MALRDVFKVNRKTFLNPKAWLGWDLFKQQTQMVYNLAVDVFKFPKKNLPPETFEEAIIRFGLSEDQIDSGIKNYRRYALLFVLGGFLVFFYAFYLMFRSGSLLAFVLALAVSILAFAQAFQYDFWAYQMRHRRLGVTFKEWLNHILGGKK